MTGGEIFGLCWLASVVALFVCYMRTDCAEGSR